AKYDAPVAVYCGSVPKAKPRCRALRGRSIDSNLQLCGSRWITEEEGAIYSLEGWDSKVSVQDLDAGAGGDLSPLPHPALTHPQEREVSSTALETTRIKDKLKKRRMSEGLLAPQRGLTDSCDPTVIALKPAVSRSASQRLLITSKPVPPIQNSLSDPEPRWTSNGEQELREGCTDHDGSEGNNKELISEASLQPLYCSDEEGKKSLGVALIPPIPKSARPSDGDPGSTEMSVPSSQQLVSQESLEMRPRSGSRTEEKTLKSLELRTLEPILPIPQHRIACSMKSAGHLYEPVPPLTGLPLSQAKETDHLLSPRLLKDDDWKESNGRIHVTISKSAQEKMRQKQMREMELLLREREKEKSLQFLTSSADPGGASREGFGPLHISGTVSISSSTSNACRSSIGTTLRKRVNRPSLPSIPIISQDTGFLRHSSANSLPAIALGSPEWGEELKCEDAWETRPFSHPEQGLLDALTWLSSNDWQLKGKGLFSIRRLAVCHSEILLCRLHDVTLAVTKEVNNLRSKVSRFAISTLGELFRIMKKHMDQEVEEVARALLQKTGDSSEFIQRAADRSLGIMVTSVTPARAMAALLAGGVNHRNVLVRKYAAEHLLTVMEQIGAEKLLSGTRDSVELLVHMLVKLAQDCNQDTRFYGRKMLNMLMSHPKFDGYLKQFLPSRDLQDVMATIKQKGVEDRISEPPSAKGCRESRNSGLMTSQENLPSNEGSSSNVLILPRQTVRRASFRTVEEIEQLKELNKLLTAKEFQTRMQGVMVLLDHCKSNPQLISANIVQIFDVFILRLQDSNKKVKQQALEVLAAVTPILRDTLHPVLVSLVAAVTDNLNSKHIGIYTAAVKVLEASIAHLDNALLLQVLAHRARFLSGRAMQDVTEQLSVLVASVYPRKAHMVERYALPVLWFFLSNMIGNGVLPGRGSNVRAAVAKLAKSLHQEMGSSLKEHAASQPPHVAKNLWQVLDLDGR
ncbi:TGRM2 protein, partial [Penelope pileata]|nr:TGRM2 protein [Penelope pileata]